MIASSRIVRTRPLSAHLPPDRPQQSRQGPERCHWLTALGLELSPAGLTATASHRLERCSGAKPVEEHRSGSRCHPSGMAASVSTHAESRQPSGGMAHATG